MKKLVFSACMAVLAAAVTLAQARPDFSGTWVPDPKKSAASGGGSTMRMSGRAVLSGGGPVEYRLSQTDKSLTIERTGGAGPQKFVHTFDGTENVNVNGRATTRTKSRWNGNQLVTEGTQSVSTDAGEITATIREVRSLDDDGMLVVEITRTTERGTTTSKQVYRKKN